MIQLLPRDRVDGRTGGTLSSDIAGNGKHPPKD